MLAIALVGITLISVYALVAYLQIAFLNPQAAMAGMTADQIWAEVAASQGNTGLSSALIYLCLGPVLALTFAAVGVVWLSRSPLIVGGVYLLLLALGSPAYFVASFGPGMSLADTYGIGGADYAVWGVVLHVVSGIALVCSITLAAIVISRRHAGGAQTRS